jgi:ribosomal-protein-alanine N-acetyltransferase
MPANREAGDITGLLIRPGTAADLPEVSAIQEASPEAAQWDPADYLGYHFLVAALPERVAGFLVFRNLGADECEVLNLVVSGDFRRKRVGRALFQAMIAGYPGAIFLEVRESNVNAQEFYKSLNFKVISKRDNYYQRPPEAAIVMKFHSC